MNNDRNRMLRTIRQAVAAGNHGVAPPHPDRNGVGWQGAGGAAVECFCQELADAGGTAHRAANATVAADIVLSLVQAKNVRQALLGTGEVLNALNLTTSLKAAGIEYVLASAATKAECFAAEIGISGVDYLIAETGSIVLLTRPEQPRSLSLLPPVHIAVARREQILDDLFDLFEEKLKSSDLPAGVSLITGPSKTGDIELKLVTGVHGPGEVHLVIF